MKLSDFLITVGGGTGDVTKVYVDGSLAMRDVSIAWLYDNKATNASVNLALAPIYSGLTDVSAGVIVSNVFNRTSQVLTLTRRDGGTLTAQFDKTYVKETSLGNTLYWNNNLLNVSTGFAYQSYVDGSLNLKANNASLGLYVQKAGDTMSGPLTISNGGLVISSGDVSLMNGDAYFGRHVHVAGFLQVDGSLIYTNKESLDVSSAYIMLNGGLVGSPPPTLQSGIIVQRGSARPYAFIYDEDVQTFRIGIVDVDTSTHYSDASTQAVATREDSPISNAVPFWNAAKYRMDTSVGFTFTPGIGLNVPKNMNITGDVSISGNIYNAGMTNVSTNNVVYFDTASKKLTYATAPSSGNMLWDVSTDTTTVYLTDPSDNVQLSFIEIQQDGGAMLFSDLPVVNASVGIEQSYDMRIDGS